MKRHTILAVLALGLVSACGSGTSAPDSANGAAPASATASASRPAGPSATFKVDQVAYTMTLPKGYCPPKGQQAEVARVIAASDTRNVTHLSLFPCDAPLITAGGDYTLLKTPNEALGQPIGRAALIAQLGTTFDSPEFTKLVQSGAMNRAATDSLNRAIPAGMKLDGTLGPLGHDDVCAYLGGVVNVTGPKGQYRQAVGVCITSIGDRAIAINRYGTRTGANDVLQLLREAKDLVAAIAPASG